jgi:MtrB/PioB family decaheme-associated outer membrane protein
MSRMILRTTVAALLAAAALPAAAAAPAAVDTSNWKCESCPFPKGYEADAGAGAIYADGANASYGRFNGIDEDKVYVDANANGSWRSEAGAFAKYSFANLGVDTRSGSIVLGREGRYDVALSYDAIPFRAFDSTRTPYAGAANLTLPSTWVRSIATTGMTGLTSALGARDIGTDRKTYGLNLRYLAGTNWTFFGGYSRQEKEGTSWTYAAFLTSAVQLPTPVDYVTDTFEAGAAWANSRSSVRLAYAGSFFRNLNTALSFQNPYTPIVPGAATGVLALAPDNNSQQIGLSGNYRFDAWNAAVTYAATVGRLKQDDAVLPVSSAANAARPIASLNGEVKLAHYGVTLSMQPIAKLALRGGLRYDERNDTTTPVAVAYVVTDTLAGGTDTTPRYDYKRTRLDGSADYVVLRWLKVGGALQWDEVKRDNQEVAKTVEDGGYLRGRLTPFKSLSLTLKGGQLHREASGFDLTRQSPGENPLLRKYNLANRDRVFYETVAAWNATEKVTVSANAKLSSDSYRKSPLGLTEGKTRNFGANVSWAITDALDVYVDGGYQKITSKQLGQARPAGAAWELKNDDAFWNAGAGGRWKLGEKWNVTADYMRAKSTGDTVLLSAGAPDPYPQLRSRLDSARVGLHYQATPLLGLHAKLMFEGYDEDTWLLDNVAPATVRNLLSLGAEARTHDVALVAFTFDYRFGNVAPPAAKAE